MFSALLKPLSAVQPESKLGNVRPIAFQFSAIDSRNYRQRVREFGDRLQFVSDCDRLLSLSQEFIESERNCYPIIGEPQVKSFQQNLVELSRLFPPNHTNPNRLRTLIKILLEQQIEMCWYDKFPRYFNSQDIKNDPQLYDLSTSSSAYPIGFSFIVLREQGIHRLLSPIKRRIRGWLNHPAGGTVGMKVTQCRPETIALLNELCDRISRVYGQQVSLQINSIIRTVEHQKHLAHLGYWAPPTSTHSTGYAADIERRWYSENNRPLFTIVERVLQDYENRSILNVIDEERVWHICLNPQWNEVYKHLIND